MPSRLPTLELRGHRYKLAQAVFLLGSHAECDVVLKGEDVASIHAAILRGESGSCWVVPLSREERSLSLGGSEAGLASIEGDAELIIGGEILTLRVPAPVRPRHLPHLSQSPEIKAERTRLWAVWDGIEDPGAESDTRAKEFLSVRKARDAATAVLETRDVGRGVQKALRGFVQPPFLRVDVEATTRDGKPCLQPLPEEGTSPAKFSSAIDWVIGQALERDGLLRRTAADLPRRPYLSVPCPIAHDLHEAFAMKVAGPEGRLVACIASRIRDPQIEPRDLLTFEAVMRAAAARLGCPAAPWPIQTPTTLLPALRRPLAAYQHLLRRDLTILGRDRALADVVLECERSSRRHACVLRGLGEKFFVVDLGSLDGTYVGEELVIVHRLRNGEILKVGTEEYRFFTDPIGRALIAEAHEHLRAFLAAAGPGGVPSESSR